MRGLISTSAMALVASLLFTACDAGIPGQPSADDDPTTTTPTSVAPSPASNSSVPPSASASATTSAHQVDGCVPGCNLGLTRPGSLPVGDYQTKWFFGGQLRVTFDEPWTSGEDSSGEFHTAPVDMPDDWILYWLDVYPVEDLERVIEVPLTTQGWLDWLPTRAGLEVSAPVATTIGGLPATSVDIAVAPDAVNEDTEAPVCEKTICVLYLGFGQWDNVWGVMGGFPQRLYFSDVSYGGKDHLFVVALAPVSTLEEFALRAEAVLDTVRAPVEPTR
ncbi:MAG TPA: hypothetical protein VMW94_09015 [Actinomycetes bacterium]|nr:hypothetical protein [Actinomycetes bacterium]